MKVQRIKDRIINLQKEQELYEKLVALNAEYPDTPMFFVQNLHLLHDTEHVIWIKEYKKNPIHFIISMNVVWSKEYVKR